MHRVACLTGRTAWTRQTVAGGDGRTADGVARLNEVRKRAVALLTKVAPQLNAIQIMFPAKIALTLMLVGLSFAVLPHALERLLEALSEAYKALG